MALPSNQRNGMHFQSTLSNVSKDKQNRLSTPKRVRLVETCLRLLMPLMQPTQWTVLVTVN